MGGRPLEQQTIEKIREMVLEGTDRYTVAEKLGIHVNTVYRHTQDMPKRKRLTKNENEKMEIRNKVLQGVSRYDLAKEYGVALGTIYNITMDIIKTGYRGNYGIRGGTLKILQQLLSEGYYIWDNKYSSSTIKTLRKYFPIRKVAYKRHSIFFLEFTKELALKAFIELLKKRTMSYRELCNLERLFGIKMGRSNE